MPHHRFFVLSQIAILLLNALSLLYFFPVAGTQDLKIIQHWMSSTGEFPLKNHWALSVLGHHYVKYILILSDLAILALWIHSYKKNLAPSIKWQYGYFFIMIILSTSLIGFLKSQSDHACPWDMTIATTTHFIWNFNLSNGHCFPGGHASAGFALMAGYFAFRNDQPKRAYFYLISGLILGFAMGWAQMMRGAHFLSHNLWTAWWIWTMNVVIYSVVAVKLPHQKRINPTDINQKTSIKTLAPSHL